MIKFGERLNGTPLQIDLNSPMGNSDFLIGIAYYLRKHFKGGDPMPLVEEMREAAYEDLLAIFEREFGEFATLYLADEES